MEVLIETVTKYIRELKVEEPDPLKRCMYYRELLEAIAEDLSLDIEDAMSLRDIITQKMREIAS